MKEISTISLERMNNGAHFLYVSNILARAEADTKVKTKAAAQVAALKAAVAQEDEDLKISQKSLLPDDIAKAIPNATPFTVATRKPWRASSTSPSRQWRKPPKCSTST